MYSLTPHDVDLGQGSGARVIGAPVKSRSREARAAIRALYLTPSASIVVEELDNTHVRHEGTRGAMTILVERKKLC